VNHCVGQIQFGDLTFIQSSYTDLGKPRTKQENKITPAFTRSQNQAYVFYTQSPILTERQLVLNNQCLDYLDNSNLGAIEFRLLYHQAIRRSKSLQCCVKFAKN
jgi:hypothetical protein